MTDRQRVDPHLQTTPSSPGTTLDRLPDDLVLEAVGRLRIACLVWMVLWSTMLAMNHLVAPLLDLPVDQVIPWPPIADALAIGCILLSGAIYRFAPRVCRDPKFLMQIGLAYEVVLAFAIGVINQWVPQVLAGRLSWICVLILVHPMIVLAPPRMTLLAALLAASMDPVGILIAAARGVDVPGAGVIFWTYAPNYICAGLAMIPSHVITRLGRQVGRARELGSYRLGDVIGEGGMGEVWRAHHRLLARPAAIKLIRRERLGLDPVAHRIAIQRFRREAEAAASLRSPHTIQLYDFGVTSDGRFYFVMELLDGLDLETLVRRFGPQPPARVVHLLRQACHSLAEAHACGLVHRDIKPANLHLCRLGLEYDFVKVLDFGLVKRDAGSSAETLMTAPDATTGTPAYMPPEMASGESIDRRVDVYALGCVGYWLLTGKLVFEADTAFRMILQHMQAAPVPPSLRTERPIPPELDRLILSCLAKNPSERPAGGAELAGLLAAVDTGGRWTDEDARRWWEENLSGSPPGGPLPIGPTVTVSPVVQVAL